MFWMLTERRLEQLCLNWLRAGGYDYAFGPDIANDGDTPERSDYRQVILPGRLISSLQKINPHIPIETLEEAALAVTKPESPVLIHNNRAFHRLILEWVPVEYTRPSPPF
jgi:type I restriction enzyme R subunit